MLFWKRGKREELSDEQIEKIVVEFMDLTKNGVCKYLPRRMRRALSKNKGWQSLSSSEKIDQIQEIKQKGLSGWLDQSAEEVFEELSSFVSESVALEEELRKELREFKKKWNIK